MNFFAIGDLHLSGTPPQKPMDIFGPHWDNHWSRIKESWLTQVSDKDVIFLVGDTSWFMHLSEALTDLEAINQLPGQKYLIRGNHDYWWSSAAKMKKAIPDLHFLQGHGLALGSVAFGGTRGYLCPGDKDFDEETDQSIYARELLRTRAALTEMDTALKANQSEDKATRILLLHYPPCNDKNEPSGFTQLMEEFHVDYCIYGHIHDQPTADRLPKSFGSTQLCLVSADIANFEVQRIL